MSAQFPTTAGPVYGSSNLQQGELLSQANWDSKHGNKAEAKHLTDDANKLSFGYTPKNLSSDVIDYTNPTITKGAQRRADLLTALY